MYIHVNGILKKCLRTIIILVVPLMNIYRDLLWFIKTKHQMRNIVLIQFVLCLYYEKLYNRITSLFEWPLCWPFPTLTMHQSLTQLCDKNKILEYLLKMSCFHHPIQNGTWMYRAITYVASMRWASLPGFLLRTRSSLFIKHLSLVNVQSSQSDSVCNQTNQIYPSVLGKECSILLI